MKVEGPLQKTIPTLTEPRLHDASNLLRTVFASTPHLVHSILQLGAHGIMISVRDPNHSDITVIEKRIADLLVLLHDLGVEVGEVYIEGLIGKARIAETVATLEKAIPELIAEGEPDVESIEIKGGFFLKSVNIELILYREAIIRDLVQKIQCKATQILIRNHLPQLKISVSYDMSKNGRPISHY